jgi:hypothetical protein
MRLPPSAIVNDSELSERHGRALATIRAYAEESGAERVAVLLDAGSEAVVVECAPGGHLEVIVGEERLSAEAEPVPLDFEVRRAPPGTAIELDLVQGEILAPVGVVAALADGVLALAVALGGRTVASADFPTRDPELALTVAAREGEGVVLAAGDEQFDYGGF